jgi:hypothetical protein|tara:strand:- start:686 stop:880 length:195 start_codon:yes stop_codon:yes gene_type:complete
MSHTRDFLEQSMDTINSDWQKEMVEINKDRESKGLPHKVFTELDKENFDKKWLEEYCERNPYPY